MTEEMPNESARLTVLRDMFEATLFMLYVNRGDTGATGEECFILFYLPNGGEGVGGGVPFFEQ